MERQRIVLVLLVGAVAVLAACNASSPSSPSPSPPSSRPSVPGITTLPNVGPCDIGRAVDWPGGHLDLALCAGNIATHRPVRLHVGDELTIAIDNGESTTSSAPAVLATTGSSRTTGDYPVVDHYRALAAGTAIVELTTSYSCLQSAGPICAVLDVTVSG